ncbi:MAG: hypothetical protein R2825_09785 [Saprospiraceae bacterium]
MIVEAVETQFVPLAIYNNKSGDDRKVLKPFLASPLGTTPSSALSMPKKRM